MDMESSKRIGEADVRWTLINMRDVLMKEAMKIHAEAADTVLRGRSMRRRVSNRTAEGETSEEANPAGTVILDF